MKYRQLGSSSLQVSEISLGSWLTFGSSVEEGKGLACVRKAFDLGINFFDTANVYGGGKAESFLGRALAGVKRDSYVLATKLYFPMSDPGQEDDAGLSQAQIVKQLDASLKRLKVDHVDLYQCHRYDRDTPLEETMAALTRAVEQGKTRYIGFSEWSPRQIGASLKLPGVHFVSSQPQYSMLWRGPEKEVFPLCAKNGIGQIVWSPLAQGVLTGKYLPGKPPPADSRAKAQQAWGTDFMQEFMTKEVLVAVQGLRPIAEELGATIAQLALAWVLETTRGQLGHRGRHPARAAGGGRPRRRDCPEARAPRANRCGAGRRVIQAAGRASRC